MSSPASQNEALLACGSQQSSLSAKELTPGFAWLTTTLISANYLVFYAMLAYYHHMVGNERFMNTRINAPFEHWILFKWGSDYGVLTLDWQYWRLITSTFIHRNVMHLCANMFFLWGFGRYVERILGRTKTLAVYLLTGVASSLLGVSWHPGAISYGASGAMYGLAGVLVAFLGFGKLEFSLKRKIGIWSWVLLITPFSLLRGHVASDIDHMGHLGGLLSGFVIGVFLAWTFRAPQEKRASRQRRVLLYAAVALIPMLAGSVLLHRNLIKLYHRELALRKEDLLASVVAHYERLVAEDPNDAEAHVDLGYVYYRQQKKDEAFSEYQRALDLAPEDYSIQYKLAVNYWIAGRYEDAVRLFRSSLPHRTANSNEYVQFAMALMATKRMDEAEEAAKKAVKIDNSASNRRFLATILELNGKTTEAKRERELVDQPSQSK